jgi:proline dehydrogenase
MTQGVSFNNTRLAFLSKSDQQLHRSKFLFRLMNNPSLVKLFSRLTVFSIRLGLPVSGIIKSTIFKQFCGGESIEESKEVINSLQHSHIGAILDYSIEGKETEEDFEKTKNEVIKIIHLAQNNPAIPYTSLKLTGIARFDLLEQLSSSTLYMSGNSEYQQLKLRLDTICNTACKAGVPIYFDAEESWIQEAIDTLALEMMRKYNREKAIVLTTLQMYRHDRLAYLEELIQTAKSEKFCLGIKLVRGAYWEKENRRAKEFNYKSPVHRHKEDTDRDFDKAVDLCLQNIDFITLCAGTHNEQSSLRLVERMKEYGIHNDHPHVYFSQLYGMSDHISYNLSAAGYNVTKYLPYGPVRSVIPYLIRRAEENTSIAGQMGRELTLITEEEKRRNQLGLIVTGKAQPITKV